MDEIIAQVKQLITDSKRICLLTGAGVSAESGVATFRGAQNDGEREVADQETGDGQEAESLWSKYDPHEMASLNGFLSDPDKVWQWYQWRREALRKALPNPAHVAIALWQEKIKEAGKQQIQLITQNVDDLHQKAGSNSIIEMHGNIWHNHCLHCEEIFHGDVTGLKTVPVCDQCGGQIRPSVVWFGESLPEQAWQAAEAAAYNCDLFLSVGTSGQVYPVAGLMMLAKSQGAKVVEINPEPTESPTIDFQIAGVAGKILPKLL